MSTNHPPDHPDRKSPYLSLLGFVAAGLICLVAAVAFLNLAEVVKLAGAPFLVLPDALGILQKVDRDEAIVLTGTGNFSSFAVELKQAGPYLIYLVPFQGTDSGQLAVDVVDGGGQPIVVGILQRGTRPYDTTAVRGFPEYVFRVDQPGTYNVILQAGNSGVSDRYTIGIVPDYITGHEGAFGGAIAGQIVLLLLAVGGVYYWRVYRPRSGQRRQKSADAARKKTEMGDFLAGLGDDPPQKE